MILNEVNTYEFPQGSVDSGKVVFGGKNNDWGGSMEKALEIASYASACSGKKNPISSQKRSRKLTAAGNTSDHYEGNKEAYAVDLPVRGSKGDDLLKCIMSKFENGAYSGYKGGKWLNVNIDGYRYQFGWRVKDHYDHIHVGVKKTGKSDDSPEDVKKTSEAEFDMTQFNERSTENLNILIDELEKKGVKDPKTAIKDWIAKESGQKELKYKTFSDILNSDEFKSLEKYLSAREVKEINENVDRIKKIMK